MSSPDAPRVPVRLVSWHEASEALAVIRRAVFIVEQSVPEALEWDDADAGALHALAMAASGVPIGTARLLPDGHIGRVAVLRNWRGRGVGRSLVRAMLEAARTKGLGFVRLDAQVQALDFYRSFGFEAHGDVFDDVGIPHLVMVLDLKSRSASPG